MFFISVSSLWSFFFFFILFYIVFFFSFLVYTIPLTSAVANLHVSSRRASSFYILSLSELSLFVYLPLYLFLFMCSMWFSSHLSLWFGSLIFGSFQIKVSVLMFSMFFFLLLIFTHTTFFSSSEIYDFFILQYHFFYWIFFLFCSNSLFSFIFLIEVTSTLILLFLVSSSYSTSFFYRTLSFEFLNFFQNSLPHTFLQSLLFFFWVSLLSSLNLFVFFIFMYRYLPSFDWYLLEHLFLFFINISSIKEVFSLGMSWFFIMFCIFLKCGIAPTFIWKPTFFKGLSLLTLCFYISYFYFFVFLIFIRFLLFYFSQIFYFYTVITLVFLSTGFIVLFFILSEAFFLKIFFAISSLLNSLLVLLALFSPHTTYTIFFL